MSQSEPGVGTNRRRTKRSTPGRDAAPVRRVRLDFRRHEDLAVADEAVRGDLSAAAFAGGALWVANDEFPTVERLVPTGDGAYGGHRAFALGLSRSLAPESQKAEQRRIRDRATQRTHCLPS